MYTVVTLPYWTVSDGHVLLSEMSLESSTGPLSARIIVKKKAQIFLFYKIHTGAKKKATGAKTDYLRTHKD